MKGIRERGGKFEAYGNYKRYKNLGTYMTCDEAQDAVNEYYLNIFLENITKLKLTLSDIKFIKNTTYYVSTTGLVINKFGEEMQGFIDKSGYKEVTLSVESKSKTLLVHRLILKTFNPVESMNLLDVNHKDGNKSNNSLTNLEWCNRSENINHSFKLGLQDNITNQHGNFKVMSREKIKYLESLKDNYKVSEISEILGFTPKTIRKYIKRIQEGYYDENN